MYAKSLENRQNPQRKESLMSRRRIALQQACALLLLLVVIGLGVVACGGSSSPSSPSGPGGTPTATQSGY
jgi:hypothetical protein